MICVGRITRSHGIRGEVVVVPDTDFGEDRFGPGSCLHGGRETDTKPAATLTVRSGRCFKGRWVVGFEGFETIEAAETLRGWELRIPESEVKALGPDTYYAYDLVGCRVTTMDGRDVGLVRKVDFGAGRPALVVEAEAGEVYVPMIDAICRQVDVVAKAIVIDAPPGLIELNWRTTRADGR
jgi:16S rRNA processing protein RimM